MANFIVSFVDKLIEYSTGKKKRTSNIPPLYCPYGNFIPPKNTHYEPLKSKDGVLLKLPNGETIQYISKNQNKDNLPF